MLWQAFGRWGGLASQDDGDALTDMESIFANGEIGDYWRFDAANTDGNIAGDDITVATGLVNGLLMEDADPTKLPTLEAGADSTFFASPSDRLVYNFGSTVAQPGTIITAIHSVNNLDAKIIYTGSATGSRWQLSVDSSFNIVGFANSGLDSTLNAPLGPCVITVEYNGASSRIRSNGTTLATGNMGTQGTNQLTVGALWDGTIGVGCGIYSIMFINRLLTASELDMVERLFGSHAGLSW